MALNTDGEGMAGNVVDRKRVTLLCLALLLPGAVSGQGAYSAGARVGSEHGVTMLSSNVRLATGLEDADHGWVSVGLPDFVPADATFVRVGTAIRVNETSVGVFAAPDTDVQTGSVIGVSSAWGAHDDYRSYTVATVPLHPGSGQFFVRAENGGGTHARYDLYLVGYEAATSTENFHFIASANASDEDGNYSGTGGGTGCLNECGGDSLEPDPSVNDQLEEK